MSARSKSVRPPAARLREFLRAYDPAVARLFFAAREAVLAASPDASELIYDAYNAVSCAYSRSDRLKDAFCHVAAYRDYVNLGFNRGAELADPDGILVGSGARIRHVRIASATDARKPAIRRLVRAAIAHAEATSAARAASRGESIVKAVYPRKSRPTRAKPT